MPLHPSPEHDTIWPYAIALATAIATAGNACARLKPLIVATTPALRIAGGCLAVPLALIGLIATASLAARGNHLPGAVVCFVSYTLAMTLGGQAFFMFVRTWRKAPPGTEGDATSIPRPP